TSAADRRPGRAAGRIRSCAAVREMDHAPGKRAAAGSGGEPIGTPLRERAAARRPPSGETPRCLRRKRHGAPGEKRRGTRGGNARRPPGGKRHHCWAETSRPLGGNVTIAGAETHGTGPETRGSHAGKRVTPAGG